MPVATGPDGVWRVAIEKPVENDRAIQTVIPVSDIGIATSGDYRNYREIAGQKFHHAMDPDTGARSSMIWERDGPAPSAASQMVGNRVAGDWRRQSLQLAEQQGLAAYFIRRDQGLRAEHTTAFAPYLRQHNGRNVWPLA